MQWQFTTFKLKEKSYLNLLQRQNAVATTDLWYLPQFSAASKTLGWTGWPRQSAWRFAPASPTLCVRGARMTALPLAHAWRASCTGYQTRQPALPPTQCTQEALCLPCPPHISQFKGCVQHWQQPAPPLSNTHSTACGRSFLSRCYPTGTQP